MEETSSGHPPCSVIQQPCQPAPQVPCLQFTSSYRCWMVAPTFSLRWRGHGRVSTRCCVSRSCKFYPAAGGGMLWPRCTIVTLFTLRWRGRRLLSREMVFNKCPGRLTFGGESKKYIQTEEDGFTWHLHGIYPQNKRILKSFWFLRQSLLMPCICFIAFHISLI